MAPANQRHGLEPVDVVARLSHYLERLFVDRSERIKDRVAERVADRVAPKVAARLSELDSYVATLEVLEDDEALADLDASAQDSGEDLQDYEAIRRDVGLA